MVAAGVSCPRSGGRKPGRWLRQLCTFRKKSARNALHERKCNAAGAAPAATPSTASPTLRPAAHRRARPRRLHHGGPGRRRADVSRRTLFNYFPEQDRRRARQPAGPARRRVVATFRAGGPHGRPRRRPRRAGRARSSSSKVLDREEMERGRRRRRRQPPAARRPPTSASSSSPSELVDRRSYAREGPTFGADRARLAVRLLVAHLRRLPRPLPGRRPRPSDARRRSSSTSLAHGARPPRLTNHHPPTHLSPPTRRPPMATLLLPPRQDRLPPLAALPRRLDHRRPRRRRLRRDDVASR